MEHCTQRGREAAAPQTFHTALSQQLARRVQAPPSQLSPSASHSCTALSSYDTCDRHVHWVSAQHHTMALSAESSSPPSPAGSGFHTAFPSTTLFSTHAHPTAPPALSCSSNHLVALLTPSLLTLQPLSNLTAPGSFPPSTASSIALPLPLTTTFAPLTFSAPPHCPHPTFITTPPAASLLCTATARAVRAAHLDVDPLPAQPPSNLFKSGKWADVAGELGVYGAVMTRGNAHLVQASSISALSRARSLCELSSLLAERPRSNDSARADTADDVEQWLARGRSVSITAIGFFTTSSSAPAHPSSTLIVAVGTKDGRVSLIHVPLPAVAEAASPRPVGSFVASAEYITELCFAPAPPKHAADAAPGSLCLAVGDSEGVTRVWRLTVEAGEVSASCLHTFQPIVPHAPVSVLVWHRPAPTSEAAATRGVDSACDACSVAAAEASGAEHVILAAAVASTVSIHFLQLRSLQVCSSYPLPAVHNQHITSLVLTALPACPLPALLSSSASSATYRHLLTPTAAIQHSLCHQPCLLFPLPARYGLSITPDGLLLLGCDVRMADTRSLKKKDGVYVVSVEAWPVSGLDGAGAVKYEPGAVKNQVKKRKRRRRETEKALETEEERSVRWTSQHELMDEFSALCDAQTEFGLPRCHFSLCLYLTARLSPLSHLLSHALSEPPSLSPHASVAHIRFLDALTAWLSSRLAAVLSLPWSAAQSRLRTLHFLATFALRCASGDCQFVELSDEDRPRVAQHHEQLEAVLSTQHFSSALETASPTHSSLVGKALHFLAPQLPSAGLAASPLTAVVEGSARAEEAERCAVCGAGVGFDSLRRAECTNGHRWWRDADKLTAVAGASYMECAQCGARAEGKEGEIGGEDAADVSCWMCGVVRALVEV